MKNPDLKKKVLAEYLEKEISMAVLAQKHGINRNTIRVWLKQRGLRNKYHKQPFLDKEKIIRMYVEERKSTEEIAPLFGVSTEPIHSILYKAGVHRTQRETMMGKWVGDKNPNWKGGMTTFEKWRRKMPHFAGRMRIFKTQVKILDDFTCRMCGSKEKTEAHHIIPVRDIKNERQLLNPKFGITLCRKCHLSIHFKERDYIEKFTELVKNRVNSGKPS